MQVPAADAPRPPPRFAADGAALMASSCCSCFTCDAHKHRTAFVVRAMPEHCHTC